jgi:quercetin dioxygenase-like cupin family protein
MLVRYAVLGPTAFALVELPETGSLGTSLEDSCEQEHWGFVLEGEVRLEGPSPHTFGPGTAFHIAPGAPAHRFQSGGAAVIAGFVPLTEPIDDTPEALRRRGLEVVRRMPAPQSPPSLMRVSGMPSRVEVRGAIELETAEMGQWLFTRTTFGPLSGYASGWCDLPHWGLVLSGDLVLNHEDEVELLTAGDVFYCPPGPPGHHFEVADQATIVDYTPIAEMNRDGRQEAWRTSHRRRHSVAGEAKTPGGDSLGNAAVHAKDARPPASQPGTPGQVTALGGRRVLLAAR